MSSPAVGATAVRVTEYVSCDGVSGETGVSLVQENRAASAAKRINDFFIFQPSKIKEFPHRRKRNHRVRCSRLHRGRLRAEK